MNIWNALLVVFAKLAPLSIVIAAIGLLHSLRQTKVKRDQDEAIKAREVLNELGTKAYLLNWSLVGGSSETKVALLEIRQAIEGRLGATPTPQSIASFVGDQLLFESIVEKGVHDSGASAKFQEQALEFGKFQAELGNRIPLIHAALGTITTRLRMLFLLDTFLIHSIRNKTAYAELAKKAPDEAMKELHRILFRAAQIPEKDEFGAACKLVEQFSTAAATASDKNLLRLMHSHPSLVQRIREILRSRRKSKLALDAQKELMRRLKDKFAGQFPALGNVAEEIFLRSTNSRAARRQLAASADRALRAFKGLDGLAELEEASEKFLDGLTSDVEGDLQQMRTLLDFKASGIDDPDIDLFLAATSGETALLEPALARGGNPQVTIGEVLERHGAKSA